MPRTCPIASEPPMAEKSIRTLSNTRPHQQLIPDLKEKTIMSLSSAPGIMLKRTVFNARLATVQPVNASRSIGRSATRGSYRTVHHSARLPAITPSETRYRPSLRPHQQPAAYSRVTGSSPSSKRTIFIQTESTPNPDVSFLIFKPFLWLKNTWPIS